MFTKPLSTIVLLLIAMPLTSFAATKTLFEGYYKINLNGEHVGYYIQKYELETSKKQFISTYFLRTNKKGGNISESLRAFATDKLKPIKYQYTSLQGTTSKTIDTNVRKNKKGEDVLQIKTTENGKLRVSEDRLKEGTFFSTFLIYLLLQGEKGVQPGVKYNFKAIAEEDAKPFPGEVYIDSETKKMGLNVYKVLYTFKRTQFVNFINSQGESLISVSPGLGLSADLVANPSEATNGMTFNTKSISLLFGEVPQGTRNELSQKLNLSSHSKGPQKLIPDTPATKKSLPVQPKSKKDQ